VTRNPLSFKKPSGALMTTVTDEHGVNVNGGGDIRRFGYYVVQPNGTMDFVVHSKVATADVLDEFHELVRVVFRLQPVVISLRIVESNARDLIAVIDNHQLELNALRTPNIVSIDAAISGLILASRGLANFLCAATSFIELTEAQLRLGYGRESKELASWIACRRSLHAKSFAYRFLYKLRNFSQHRSLPISNFNISGVRDSGSGAMKFEVGIDIVRDALRASGFNWGGVGEEIARQPSRFDVLPLVFEFLALLRTLCREVFKIEAEALAQCHRYLSVLKAKIAVPQGAVPAIFVGHSAAPDVPPMNHEVIPDAQLRWLLREYDELVGRCDDRRI